MRKLSPQVRNNLFKRLYKLFVVLFVCTLIVTENWYQQCQGKNNSPWVPNFISAGLSDNNRIVGICEDLMGIGKSYSREIDSVLCACDL